MKIRAYSDADAGRWDEFVERCPSGTFLHTRRFLAYHRARFEDRSLVCEDERGRMVGVFPAAARPDDPACIVSHPGATYGGLTCDQDAMPGDVEEMMAGIVGHYRARGCRSLDYKSVPPHLQAPFSQADVHVLWKLGAQIARRDLWSVVPLRGPGGYSDHHKREIARAAKRAIVTGRANSDAQYRRFHALLAACLAERHGASPVHTPEELLELRDRFPREIALWLAHDGADRVLAGCWVFLFADRCWHTQYIATSSEGRSQGAGYLVINEIIREALERRVPCLSFGASTEEEGRELNAGLFDFKSGFGAGPVCHDVYRLRFTS